MVIQSNFIAVHVLITLSPLKSLEKYKSRSRWKLESRMRCMSRIQIEIRSNDQREVCLPIRISIYLLSHVRPTRSTRVVSWVIFPRLLPVLQRAVIIYQSPIQFSLNNKRYRLSKPFKMPAADHEERERKEDEEIVADLGEAQHQEDLAEKEVETTTSSSTSEGDASVISEIPKTSLIDEIAKDQYQPKSLEEKKMIRLALHRNPYFTYVNKHIGCNYCICII